MSSYNTHHLAFLFPGQGSQSVGMLGELAQNFSIIPDTYAEASEVLGHDLWQLVQNGPEAMLNQTEHTQPALLAGGVAMFRVWKSLHTDLPMFMAGHSLGEYSALVCAGALNYQDAITLVALRGQLMQKAVPEGEGAMAAIIGLNEEQIVQVCAEAEQGQILAPANFNAIGQTVLAGETAAILRAMEIAKRTGAKLVKQIPVSVPSHCALMKPAAEEFLHHLREVQIKKPKAAILSNVDVAYFEDPDQIRSALARQLYCPVRWVQIIQTFAQKGVQRFIECGPGRILAGLNKRIVPDLPIISMSSLEDLQALTI